MAETSLVYGVMLTMAGVCTPAGRPAASAGRYTLPFSTVPSLILIGTSQSMWMFGYCCGPSSVAVQAVPAAPPSGPVAAGAAEDVQGRNGRVMVAATAATVTRNAYFIGRDPPLEMVERPGVYLPTSKFQTAGYTNCNESLAPSHPLIGRADGSSGSQLFGRCPHQSITTRDNPIPNARRR